MLYTIGHQESYHRSRSYHSEVFKRGRYEDYPGGYAFLTYRDAQRRINEAYVDQGFAVFGLDTTWDKTVKSSDGWWHHVLDDTLIIFLEDEFMDKQQLKDRNAHVCTHHPPITEQVSDLHEAVRLVAENYMNFLVDTCVPGRELSLALTKAEESMMFANASIARNQSETQDPESEGEVYSHPSCVYRYCADPESCSAIDDCQYPRSEA